MTEHRTKGGHESGDTPVSEMLARFPNVLLRPATDAVPEYAYTVTVHDKDGRQAAVAIGPVEGAVSYNEYWTGPSPWWKRIWRRR